MAMMAVAVTRPDAETTGEGVVRLTYRDQKSPKQDA